jgi:hypothetical protein
LKIFFLFYLLKIFARQGYAQLAFIGQYGCRFKRRVAPVGDAGHAIALRR